MKNKSFLILAVLFAVTITIAIVSCKKEKQVEKTDYANNPTKIVLSDYGLSEEDQFLIAFGEKMKNASTKQGCETMPLKEGLVTMSNYQNFSMCDASHISPEMIVDTFRYSLIITNGEVSLFDLNNLYETSKVEIQKKYASINSDQKTIFSIWTSIPKTTRDDLNNYTGSVEVDIVTRMAESYYIPRSLTEFDSSDYWIDFDSLGKCGFYNGQYVGRDCVTELNDKLFNRWDPVMCPQGYRRYLTYIHDETIQALDYPCLSSPNGFFAWPYRSGLEPTACVNPSQMWWYLYRIESDMDDLENEYEQSIVLFSLDEVYKIPWKEANYIWEAFMNVTLANINCTPISND